MILTPEIKRIELGNLGLDFIVEEPFTRAFSEIEADQFLTTLPLTRFLTMLDPALPAEVTEACRALYYRDHITVNLVAEGADLFPDQWIYVHAPDVKMARLANYRNFSPLMAGSADVSPISVEYFVFRDDPLWSMADADLVRLATDELARMRLIPSAAVGPGWVVRETDSYPTYYLGFAEPYGVARNAVASLSNVQPAGRGGLYKYNNMDHSLYSGLLAARNLLAGQRRYDVWQINIDAEYHEAASRPA